MPSTMDSVYVGRSRVAPTPGVYNFDSMCGYTVKLLFRPLWNVCVDHGRD